KREQWVSFNSEVELLDMPGVLWPKFEDPKVGEKLAFTGAVKDEVVDLEMLSARLLAMLIKTYPDSLKKRYKLDESQSCDGYELLKSVAKKRGMLLSGGEVDTQRASIMVMDEYRSGKLGRISLEKPSDIKPSKKAL
ncbi:MAG: ribosome biogenesis GTPase YlqF, partial [Oscillospiraceae bacterium]